MMQSNQAAGGANPPRKIKVMIVDDSVVIRSIIDKILKTDEENIQVCGFASNGAEAVRSISVCNPDVVILDIEMPEMDGITALPLLLEKKKDARILMCSTLSDRGAAVSIKALSLGATDCILKPTGPDAIRESGGFHTGLLRMVKTIGASAIRSKSASSAPVTTVASKASHNTSPHVVAIGSSTGGPNALMEVLKNVDPLPVPLVITQHMPKTFTKILAGHIKQATNHECIEGEQGMKLEAGKIYIAPGGFHMLFTRVGEDIKIKLDDGPMVNFCKPAVDPMLRSLMQIYGPKIYTVILTGMGEDGLAGCKELVEKGGEVIAQDEATSIVWGMPGAVAKAGICSEVLPLGNIAAKINEACKRSLVPGSMLNRGAKA